MGKDGKSTPCEQSDIYYTLALTAWHKAGLYVQTCCPIRENLEGAEFLFNQFFKKYLRFKKSVKTLDKYFNTC